MSGPSRDVFFMGFLLRPLRNPSRTQDFRALRAVTAVRTVPIRVHPCPIRGYCLFASSFASPFAPSRLRGSLTRATTKRTQISPSLLFFSVPLCL